MSDPLSTLPLSKSHTITVDLTDDFLNRQVRAAPVVAISELIWNALDAEAENVDISLHYAGETLIESITVTDDGLGIDPDLLQTTLSRIGESWKKKSNQTLNGKRSLHGKDGQGRFQPFAVGALVEWDTVFLDEAQKELREFRLSGNRARLREFTFTDPEPTEKETTGTVVTISNIDKRFPSLEDEQAQQRFTQEFALYLSQYPDINVRYNGERLDPKAAWLSCHEEELTSLMVGEKEYPVSLTIIEWDSSQERSICLCNEEGIKLAELPKDDHKIRVKGLNYTAYIKSSYFTDLQKKGELDLASLKPEVTALVEETKDAIRKYWLTLRAQSASDKVKQWKDAKVYPYKKEPAGVIEKAERELFDVLAITVNDNLKGFPSSELGNQRFVLELVKNALEQNPGNLQTILQEVLQLKQGEQDDLASLLRNEQTTLPSIIKAARTVADRLDFLYLLESLLYVPENKQKLRERSELHKLLEKEFWIFGEEFSLGVSDQSLKAVLKRHREKLGLDKQGDEYDESEVTDLEGKRRIVDLMLSARIPQNNEEHRRHLVIELKAPKQKINRKVIEQIEDYARGVAADERFKSGGIKVEWDFIAISNDFDANAEARAESGEDDYGLIEKRGNYRIWIMRWSQILEACRARYSLFQKHLQYEADEETAREYLEKKYEEIFGDPIMPDNK